MNAIVISWDAYVVIKSIMIAFVSIASFLKAHDFFENGYYFLSVLAYTLAGYVGMYLAEFISVTSILSKLN